MLLDTGAGPSFLPLPNSVLEQLAAGNTDPGVTTIKMPDSFTQKPTTDQPVREVDIELCFVCKKCRLAFTGESPLLTHQRQCYGGGKENNRGAYRIVQIAYECRVCPTITTDKFKSPADLIKHCDSEVHQKNLKNSSATTTSSVNSAIISKNSGNAGAVPPESPLSHEMEDVVNQITLLAARAAQESIPERGGSNNLDSNSNTFCSPSEPKRRFLSPADVTTTTTAQQQQPLTSGGH